VIAGVRAGTRQAKVGGLIAVTGAGRLISDRRWAAADTVSCSTFSLHLLAFTPGTWLAF